MDCDFDSKTKLYLLEKKGDGLAVLVTLWQMIYSSEGYYINHDDDLFLLVAQRINVDINVVDDCINACLRRQIFDEVIHSKHKILTSRALQTRYFEASTRKKKVFVNENYLLIPVDSYKNLVNVNINPVNVGINATNVNVKEDVNVNVNIKGESACRNPKPETDPPLPIIAKFKPSKQTLEILKFRNQKTPTDSDELAFIAHYHSKHFADDDEIQNMFLKWMARQTALDAANNNRHHGGGSIPFPAKNDQQGWVSFARKNGISTRAGESQYEFEIRVRKLVTKQAAEKPAAANAN